MTEVSTAVPVQPSNDLTYADQRSFGVIAGRSTVEISPKYGGQFKAGDVIRLEIPSQAWLDPKDFFISFRTSIQAGAVNNAGIIEIDKPNILPHMTLQSTMYEGVKDEQTKGEMSVRFLPGIQCIFSRMRLLAGSVVIEDIQDYNILYRLFMEHSTTREWRATDGFTQEGWYDPEDPVQLMSSHNWHARPLGNGLVDARSNPGHTFTIRPLFGLFLANKMLPLKFMGQLTIEMYLEQNEECLWSTSSYLPEHHYKPFRNLAETASHINAIPAPPNAWQATTVDHYGSTIATEHIVTDYPNARYTVDNVNMHIPFVHPIDSFDSQMMTAIESGKLDIHFSTWQMHSRQIPSISGRATVSFQERAVSLKGGLCCMRNSPDIRQIDSDMNFPANGIASYQWKVGSEYIPAQDVKCTEGAGRALSHLKQALGQYSDLGATSTVTEVNYLPTDLPSQMETTNMFELSRGCSEPSKFVMGLSLEKSRGQTSGFDSSASSVDVELILQLRNHHDIVGKINHNTHDSIKSAGAMSTCTFQPSKKRCIGRERADISHTATQAGTFIVNTPHKSTLFPGSASFVTNNGATDGSGLVYTHNTDHTRRYGHMATKNLIVSTVTPVGGGAGAHRSAVLNVNTVTYAFNETGSYARIYFFAHLDAVLKLSAVGRMEIIR